MKRLVVAVVVLFSAEAVAQQACVRPTAPVFPLQSTASALTQPQIEAQRTARDTYFTAADANLACLDREIDTGMRALFASGAPMDPALRQKGLAHEDASRERAATYERFLRLCLAWEDATHTALPGGCAPALQDGTPKP